MADLTYTFGEQDAAADGAQLHELLRKLSVSTVEVNLNGVNAPLDMPFRKVTVNIGGPDIFTYDLEFDEDD